MLLASHLHNLLTLLRFAVPAAPATLATVTSTLRPHVCLLQPPPGLERYAHLCTTRGIPVKAVPVRPRLCTSISVKPHVSTTQVGTHPMRSATTYKRSVSTALAGTHNPVGADPRAGTGPFPKPRALVLPMVKFGQSKPDGIGHIDTSESVLMYHQYRLSVLQWNPGQARRDPTNIIATAFARFHAIFFKKPVIMFRNISDQSTAHTGNTDLAILLNKDTFEPDSMVLAFRECSTSKCTWGMVLLIVRGLLRRPFSFRYSDGHFLLCAHPECCGQET